MTKNVAVIGAGLGGLSAALRLAYMGFEVSIYEQNATAGGKLNQLLYDDYRFDTGPSLLTMPFVLDELFYFIGKRRQDYLDFAAIDPVCNYFWPDGSKLSASTTYEIMKKQMALLSVQDAENYKRFLEYSRGIYDLSADVFLFTPIHEWRKLLTRHVLRKLRHIGQIDPWRTVHQGVRHFFSDPRIVQLFDRYATYNGSDPFQAPATLNIIPYVEYMLGSFYIRGGMYRLAEVLLNLLQEAGARVHFSSRVEKIVTENKQVRAVRVDGRNKACDYVVCNADVVTSHQDLIDAKRSTRRRLSRLEPSLSGFVFLWGVRGQHNRLAHHNILFSRDYRREFQQLFGDKVIPDDPTVYISITSKSDPGHAPAGAENWFVLLNMPWLSDSQDWTKAVDVLRRAVFTKLHKTGLDIQNKIEFEKTISPEDFFHQYGSNRGSIYGLSSNSRMAAFRRPANRSRAVKGLYFTGGSSHPGGGIPLVMLSGKLVSELISEKEQKAS